MDELTVVVGTFGDPAWRDLAYSRAIPSVPEGVPVVHRHGLTLAQARNEGLALVRTPYVIHLDADDELEDGYCEAMAAGSADLRAPLVRYVVNDQPRGAAFPRVAGHQHVCEAECLRDGNWLVVGSAVRTQLLREVGGWREEPVYEDWSAWLRVWRAGGSVERISGAIYRAHHRPDSRNRGPSIELKNRVHHEIVASVFGDEAVAA